MNRPWMPLYVGDYLGDTGHLTTAQHGAYLLLMMHYWRKGELPDDDRQLCKIAKLPLKTWCEYRATLQDFFYEGWKHKRIDAELAKMMRVSEKRAIAGQKGGIGSALARMRLENGALSRRVPSQAIAGQSSGRAAAGVDHSHPHQKSFQGGGEFCRTPETAAARACATAGDSRQLRAGGLCRQANHVTAGQHNKRTTKPVFSNSNFAKEQSDMARAKRKKPHNPAKIHDRRSRDLLRNAEVAAIEVDDPLGLDPGDKIVTLRSIRNDPLARLHTHRQIDEAQYQGGRAFQDDWEKAERGPQAVDPSREYVDGGQRREPITERQRKAVLRLNRAEHELGADGSALVHEVLVLGMTMEQIGERRGVHGQRWIDYFARRFRECLDRLALLYGFATERR